MEAKQTQKILLIISIGPVQEFIAQARKTRDLWFGSYLLSQLSMKAANRLRELEGELIFPHIPMQKAASEQVEVQTSARVANKLLVLIHTEDPKQLALDIRQAVINEWRFHADQVRDLLVSSINPAMWKRQINDLVEFHAAWSLIEEGQDYKEVWKQTEGLLAGRKTLRDFVQNDPGKLFGEQKSSLNGGRESVLLPSRAKSYVGYGIKENETLDAISLVKRLSLKINPDKVKFLSVCDVAFLHYRHALDMDLALHELVHRYYQHVESICREKSVHFNTKRIAYDSSAYDSRLFYESRIEDYVEEHCTQQLYTELKQEITTRISDQLQQLLLQTGKQPTPYYAFLVCDGDSMGAHMSKLSSAREHQEFTKRLSGFSDLVEDIVATNKGQLIYSGGDDVMAYFPLNSVLEACGQLQQAFLKSMSDGSEAEQPTLSVGVVIVHMFEMLGEVRRLAIAAEKSAKIHRNELAIQVHKRGGGDLMKVSLSFKNDPISALTQLKDYFRNAAFSSGFAYELRSLYDEYSKSKLHAHIAGDDSRMLVLIQKEVERLVWKKRPEQISKERTAAFLVFLMTLLTGQNKPLEQLRLLAEQTIITVTLEQMGGADNEAAADPTA